MNLERAARLFVIGLAAGVPLALMFARWVPEGSIEIHGAMAEAGGWTPETLSVPAGEPLHLRLTSDDVMHGFAVGQMEWPALDLKPGEWVETSLTFDRPGKYTFYCTRWCGPNHWRMRGTIEVTGPMPPTDSTPQPLYVALGLDLDAPHPAAAGPGQNPSAERGAQFAPALAAGYWTGDYYRARSPSQVFLDLRADPANARLTDADVWDLVAAIWAANTTPAALAEARQLFAANCAACHGESGASDGVMAEALAPRSGFSRDTQRPARFTDPALLGASPALLQGKIIRGGMGTGMPYWGPIFTEAQTWGLVSYLYTFHFKGGIKP